MYHTDDFGVTRAISAEEARAYGITDGASNEAHDPKRTYVQSLKLFTGVAPNGFKLAFEVVLKMLQAFSSPAVVWAILASSISLGKFVFGALLRASETDCGH